MLKDVFTNSLCIGTASFVMATTFASGTVVNTYAMETNLENFCDNINVETGEILELEPSTGTVSIVPVAVLKKYYLVDPIDEVSINSFGWLLSDLLRLKKYIADSFGRIVIVLETYNINGEAHLLITVHSPDNMTADEAIDKFYEVTEKWYMDTDDKASKFIFINLV